MRKIPRNLECPIDNILIDLCEPCSIFFKKLNFTPNGITILSLIFGVLAVVFLYKDHPVLSVIFYYISYFFDCLDGYYARKYDMVTKFGDMLDHIKDWCVNIAFTFVLYKKYKNKLTTTGWVIAILFFLFLFVMQLIFFGCQERYYDKLDDIPSLRWVSRLIKNKEQACKTLKWVRFFGCGSFIFFIGIFTLFLAS
jgi:phosphatidylglycerophosphate synthase